MRLSTYVSQVRQRLFQELKEGRAPSEGEVDETLLAEARIHGQPQLGTTRYEPSAVVIEFIYPAAGAASIVVPVRLATPERIVFLPVPAWVIESIWQGDIDGSYAFESEARDLVHAFQKELDPTENLKWFGPRQPKRRE
ncbi:MAG TPA: hypothetical protein VM328_03330 [Fimbriimonadaceae bacterium]|nr:hypothetical protein [Fimbriimonadaceae bacterium]